ncbi:hypothetical protein HMPREF1868_01725 [Olsenella sp. DNF00959]|nr:hypothetical protein HMPREF1868_01725 [Olsenella sp. DNF00959]
MRAHVGDAPKEAPKQVRLVHEWWRELFSQGHWTRRSASV